MYLGILFQLMPDDGDDRVHLEGCEEGLHIKRCNAFPFPRSDGFDLVHNVLGIS